MMAYLPTTRHPWPCLLFLLPLLLAYEGGVLWMGGAHTEVLRPGADAWLHLGLQAFGLTHAYWTPLVILGLLVGWSFVRRRDRPKDTLGTCSGMAIESVLFALGLWSVSRGLNPLLDSFGIKLSSSAPADEGLVQVITSVGAGIYEELLFRLLLFSGVVWGLKQASVPPWLAILLAAGTSALIFSAAHHVGPYGEKFDRYVFLFRTLAGLYFAFVYQFRGFGVAVGAHACYDIVVSVTAG
jgi:Type II CAAX prenyl endopeptidase Rce1-like